MVCVASVAPFLRLLAKAGRVSYGQIKFMGASGCDDSRDVLQYHTPRRSLRRRALTGPRRVATIPQRHREQHLRRCAPRRRCRVVSWMQREAAGRCVNKWLSPCSERNVHLGILHQLVFHVHVGAVPTQCVCAPRQACCPCCEALHLSSRTHPTALKTPQYITQGIGHSRLGLSILTLTLSRSLDPYCLSFQA